MPVAVEYFTVYSGESRTIPLRITYPDCTSFDLTGTVDMQVRFRKKDGQALIKTLLTEGPLVGGVSIVDAPSGRMAVALSSDDTDLFKLGERQDFTVIIFKGNRAQVVVGPVTIKAVVPGNDMNGVELVFNGTATVQQVVDAYNAINQPDQEIYFLGSGATVPAAATVVLSGGTDNKRMTNFLRGITVLKQSV